MSGTTRRTAAACPCGTGLSYSHCCGPRHRWTDPATTAEELMRSRYSAYAKRLPAYLLRTWAPETRPDELDFDPSLEWIGLEVIATTAGGADDAAGVVEFAARHRRDDVEGVLHERSTFRREDGVWVYVDEQGAAHV